MYAKDPYEAIYQFLIEKRKSTGLKHFNDPIEWSSDMHDVYKNIDEYSADKERKILIVFDDMIADLINKKELNSKVTELFIRGRKKIFLLFSLHSHILRFQRMLDLKLLTFLPWKFLIKKSWTIFFFS